MFKGGKGSGYLWIIDYKSFFSTNTFASCKFSLTFKFIKHMCTSPPQWSHTRLHLNEDVVGLEERAG